MHYAIQLFHSLFVCVCVFLFQRILLSLGKRNPTATKMRKKCNQTGSKKNDQQNWCLVVIVTVNPTLCTFANDFITVFPIFVMSTFVTCLFLCIRNKKNNAQLYTITFFFSPKIPIRLQWKA